MIDVQRVRKRRNSRKGRKIDLSSRGRLSCWYGVRGATRNKDHVTPYSVEEEDDDDDDDRRHTEYDSCDLEPKQPQTLSGYLVYDFPVRVINYCIPMLILIVLLYSVMTTPCRVKQPESQPQLDFFLASNRVKLCAWSVNKWTVAQASSRHICRD